MSHGGRIALLPLLECKWSGHSRKELYSLILCGEIAVDGEIIRDPQYPIAEDSDIQIRRARFVGRGGEKLNAVLEEMEFDPRGKICLDAGASTGGFTDCLLQRGAKTVHAVDVGYNQIAWKLRIDQRVILHERTNLMKLQPGDLQPSPMIAVADLSFRSLRTAASALLKLTGGGPILALVKPQFENPDEKGFDGVVRNNAVRRNVMQSLRRDLKISHIFVQDAAASILTGKKGNSEIFLLLSASQAIDRAYVEERWDFAIDEAERMSALRQAKKCGK